MFQCIVILGAFWDGMITDEVVPNLSTLMPEVENNMAKNSWPTV